MFVGQLHAMGGFNAWEKVHLEIKVYLFKILSEVIFRYSKRFNRWISHP